MYFEQPGKVNTRDTLTAAYERARALGLDEVVVASTSGETAFVALEIFESFRITAVTYHHGFIEPFKPIMPYRTRKQLEEKGVAVISATHALSGVERAVAKKHGGIYPALLIADTLKLFGQGTKVAVEVSIMAADGARLQGKTSSPSVALPRVRTRPWSSNRPTNPTCSICVSGRSSANPGTSRWPHDFYRGCFAEDNGH